MFQAILHNVQPNAHNRDRAQKWMADQNGTNVAPAQTWSFILSSQSVEYRWGKNCGVSKLVTSFGTGQNSQSGPNKCTTLLLHLHWKWRRCTCFPPRLLEVTCIAVSYVITITQHEWMVSTMAGIQQVWHEEPQAVIKGIPLHQTTPTKPFLAKGSKDLECLNLEWQYPPAAW